MLCYVKCMMSRVVLCIGSVVVSVIVLLLFFLVFFFLMIRRPPSSTPLYSSAASDVFKSQQDPVHEGVPGGKSPWTTPGPYTHLRAHETPEQLVCRPLPGKKKKKKETHKNNINKVKELCRSLNPQDTTKHSNQLTHYIPDYRLRIDTAYR